MYFLYLARIFHESASALASPLFPQETFLSRSLHSAYFLRIHWSDTSLENLPISPRMACMQELQEQIPVKTKSCAIIAAIHELSGLAEIVY